MRTPAGQPAVASWMESTVSWSRSSPAALTAQSGLLGAERELVVGQVGEAVVEPEPLQSQGRHDARRR